MVLCVCTLLHPGITSNLLAITYTIQATSKDGKAAGIELVEPPPGAKVGERIYFEGYEGKFICFLGSSLLNPITDKEPLSQLNPKKKIFETIQPGFITLDTHEAAWVDPVTKTAHRIRTKEGVCIAPTYVGASLS
jgi:aminoacyl tRNA synthase complex-interacting multifunctional protein 1